MKKTAQSSTQAFTQIQDIRDEVVLLNYNNACLVIKVTSVNFTLLSGQEQDAKVFAYATLLNSLSFPIQILVRSKPIEISPYIDSINNLIAKTPNPNLKTYMERYKDFITNLVQTSSVLDKQFYIIISYSSLESGVTAVVKNSEDQFFQQAQANLQTKAESLLSQIHRLSLQASILKKEELTKLFYDIYNQGETLFSTNLDIEKPMVQGTS